jgi:hypothetical protein
MIEKMVDADYNGDTQSWASALAEEIRTGTYQSDAPGWISCSRITEHFSRRTIEDDVKDILNTPQTPFQVAPMSCPLVWAKEANAYDCVCLRCLFFSWERFH